MSRRRHTVSLRWAAVAATLTGALVVIAAVPLGSSAAPTISQLNAQLSDQRAQQQDLSASVSSLSQAISSLDSQTSLVVTREAAVQTDLERNRTSLAEIRMMLIRERRLVPVLRRRLGRARAVLARQVVSRYESDRPDLVGVVVESRGFTDLLERLEFLHRAEVHQQNIIKRTQTAKAQADTAERHLTKLETADAQTAEAASVRTHALDAMNSLLQAKQAALGRARAAQQAALQASRAKGRELRSAITQAKAVQATEEAAASAAAARQAAYNAAPPPAPAPAPHRSSVLSGSAGSGAGSSALAPSAGWAIPYPVVLCESGGQNLPPNGSGASGYYQILASTWKQFGGHGAAAYLASKPEQDAVASRIWAGGAGASNWVCATVAGKH